jgi:hypothetical protein
MPSEKGSMHLSRCNSGWFCRISLADILHNRDAIGRISKWAVELGGLNINFKPRTAIKSQALVDFMAEW